MGQKVIVIVGPTCSGKTLLGMGIATKINGEIISADSRQIYKRLNIGTAKPSKEELEKVKHHFIDILDREEEYDANSFSIQAEKTIDHLIKERKTPIVVGGSGLYIKALIDGIVESADRDDAIREKLLSEKENFGNEYLYKKLEEVDPESAANMVSQNWKRVIRALEVFELTGKPILQHHKHQESKSKFEFTQIGLKWPRDILYENINKRVDKMINDGFVDEVQALLNAGYGKKLNSLNTVGYKEIISHLEGEITLERAIELIKRNTRRYAKRQFTWFNADDRIKWYDVSSNEEILNLVPQLNSLRL
ncbi:tRNA (adenosine(37)-N6)-dimethylallyltransferase MiaA [Bacteroidota bacterium]